MKISPPFFTFGPFASASFGADDFSSNLYFSYLFQDSLQKQNELKEELNVLPETSEKDILHRVKANFGNRLTSLDSKPTDGPAKTLKIEGTNTSIGTISAVSNNFCSSCNRVRLTAQGELILCLGQKDSVSLRDAIRSGMNDDEVKQLILNAITKKPEKHYFDSVIDNISNRQMVEMGG